MHANVDDVTPDRELMSPQFSAYLDLLRLFAALAVLLSHAKPVVLLPEDVSITFGHNAVVVFFVLSGYVISHVSLTKDRTASDFWLNRFARIYSVALPAVITALVIDSAGEFINFGYYQEDVTTHDHAIIRFLASITFTNELWFLAILSYSNTPYWSLCYEMAYYLLFSIWAYAPEKKRWHLIGLVCLIVGPKILLLAPIWLAGVVLHRWRAGYLLNESTAWLLWLGSIVAIGWFQYADLNESISLWSKTWLGERLYVLLNQSQYFLADYILSVFVGAHFLGFRQIAFRFDWFARALQRWIVPMAASTFSLYLFHAPLLHFFQAIFVDANSGFRTYLGITVITICSCLLLSRWTEHRKNALRAWLKIQQQALKSRFGSRPSPMGPQ
jgi:peptidoglycan/LPS O-acetylase OafA/YrhL